MNSLGEHIRPRSRAALGLARPYWRALLRQWERAGACTQCAEKTTDSSPDGRTRPKTIGKKASGGAAGVSREKAGRERTNWREEKARSRTGGIRFEARESGDQLAQVLPFGSSCEKRGQGGFAAWLAFWRRSAQPRSVPLRSPHGKRLSRKRQRNNTGRGGRPAARQSRTRGGRKRRRLARPIRLTCIFAT